MLAALDARIWSGGQQFTAESLQILLQHHDSPSVPVSAVPGTRAPSAMGPTAPSSCLKRMKEELAAQAEENIGRDDRNINHVVHVEHALDAKPAPFLLGKGAGIAAVAACSDHAKPAPFL